MFEDVEAGRMGQTEYTYGFSLSFGFVDRGTFMYEMTIPKEETTKQDGRASRTPPFEIKLFICAARLLLNTPEHFSRIPQMK